ncbi:MAG: hypothetical protein PPHEINF_2009 [uncultured Paraburkholderia sp.]|nr:MAG: hypothetical protein PPHEINF_2009 [uncultured Paraburkholderia sp.]CAH2784070.1 MAG: hypothetical protein PPHEESC_1829 [uncultured Paraburkholderia sp.]CAH2916405.1 MAG: hypothetical protein PPHERAN_1474 [uncultured Paraburkholderia sp.]
MTDNNGVNTMENTLKRPMFQLSIGGLLGLGAISGIEARSWGSFLSMALIALYLFAFAASRQAARASRRPVRIAGNTATAVCAALLVGMFLLVAERVYLVNGSSYPRWFAHDLGAANYSDLDRLQGTECKGEGMEIYGKHDNRWVIRCGFSWIDGRTYISSTNPYGHMLDGIKQEGQQ